MDLNPGATEAAAAITGQRPARPGTAPGPFAFADPDHVRGILAASGWHGDPQAISYADLLDVFFATHDPTTLNRQGNDVGPQYRSAIFYQSPEQKAAAEAKIRELTAANIFDAPIVTEVVPLTEFYSAEDYHQGYFRANPQQPYCAAVVSPKVAKFRKSHFDRLKKRASAG